VFTVTVLVGVGYTGTVQLCGSAGNTTEAGSSGSPVGAALHRSGVGAAATPEATANGAGMGTVLATAYVALLITDTEFALWLATYNSEPSGEVATDVGPEATDTVATTPSGAVPAMLSTATYEPRPLDT
jgi:hypothetical protein